MNVQEYMSLFADVEDYLRFFTPGWGGSIIYPTDPIGFQTEVSVWLYREKTWRNICGVDLDNEHFPEPVAHAVADL